MDTLREYPVAPELSGTLFDMHAHLGFLLPGEEWSLPKNVRFLNATVTPEDYAAVRPRFAEIPGVWTAPGLHPWYLNADPETALAQAQTTAELIRPGQPVGEIGLDFAPRHAHTKEVQVQAFRRVVAAATQAGECILTLHSVQASGAVLEILHEQGFFATGTAIFHWFSGSSQHLTEVLRAGAYVSVNPHMLLTKRGREYARVIPTKQLLLETDYPAEDGTLPKSFRETLTDLLYDMAQLRGCDVQELSAVVAENSRRLSQSW